VTLLNRNRPEAAQRKMRSRRTLHSRKSAAGEHGSKSTYGVQRIARRGSSSSGCPCIDVDGGLARRKRPTRDPPACFSCHPYDTTNWELLITGLMARASTMIIACVLLCGYLLIGLAIAVCCDAIFKLSFSPKETALLALAWPFYILGALRDAPTVHWLLTRLR